MLTLYTLKEMSLVYSIKLQMSEYGVYKKNKFPEQMKFIKPVHEKRTFGLLTHFRNEH